MLESRLATLKAAGLEAGACLKEYFGKELHIRKKGNLDLVTLADETAEKLVLQMIRDNHAEDGILAEESGSHEGTSGFCWVIDPLDGTTNFAHGLGHFAVSIALQKDGETQAGVVFDPIKNEWFEAVRGSGASLNGHEIHCSSQDHLNDALVATGFSYDRRTRMSEMTKRVERILQNCRGMRRYGAAALDLAYIAAGRFDIFFEDGLSPWDIAAGALLVQEAGGEISAFGGGPFELARGEIMAANSELLALAQTLVEK